MVLSKIHILFIINLVLSVFHIQANKVLQAKIQTKLINVPEWVKNNIKKDLENFANQGILFSKIIDFEKKDFAYKVKCIIKNNKFKLEYDQSKIHKWLYDARIKYLEIFFNDLCLFTNLPDTTFFIFIGDGFRKNFENLDIPIFAFSKSIFNPNVMLMPDTAVLRLHKNLLDIINKNDFNFDKKINKLIWRGITTCGYQITLENYKDVYRVKLVALSNQFPSVIDAKFNQISQSTSEIKSLFKKLNYLDKSLSIEEHLKYKYQMLIDGNTTSWTRAYWQLLTKSLIFKHDSDNIQWYYSCLKPDVHYIKVNRELTDLIDKIKWAQQNETQVKKIIRNANNFAKNNLMYEDMIIYMHTAITEYTRLLR